jgi:lysozyme-like protein
MPPSVITLLGLVVGLLVPAVRVSTVQVTPDPNPPPPVVIAPPGLHCPEFYAIALGVGWESPEIPQLDRIEWRESHCEPGASHRNANGTIDRGLVQINSIHLSWLAAYGIGAMDLFDPAVNLYAARLLFDRDGWAPWRPLP